ncbi:hypothetical protein SODG_006906 [Sodalis praecaptivus]|nr:hypothetical protein NVIRENTERO_02768 [Sodalis praecaptivus]
MLKISYGARISNPHKLPLENVTLFVERIAYSRFEVNRQTLYNQGLELKWEDEIIELAKEIFIPFYSCVKGFVMEDVNQIVIDCTIDVVFTARPFLKGVIKATSGFSKAQIASLLKRMASVPRFLSREKSIKLNTVKLKYLITSKFIDMNDIDQLIIDVSKLTFDAIDPGIMALYDINRGAYRALKALARGNSITLYSYLYSKSKEIVELII